MALNLANDDDRGSHVEVPAQKDNPEPRKVSSNYLLQVNIICCVIL